MKFLLLLGVFVFSLSTFASKRSLKCELFEDDRMIRSASRFLDWNGNAELNLGTFDVYGFGGFALKGIPITFIVSAEKSKNTESSSQSVISTTGSTLTVNCSI
jgi:hypothetical protein